MADRDYGIETLQRVENPQVAQEFVVTFVRTPNEELVDAEYSVISAQWPASTNNPIERWFMGFAYNSPGTWNNHGSVQVVFEEDDEGAVIEALVSWRDSIKDARSGRAVTRFINTLKGDMIIQSLARTHAEVARACILRGVYPQEIQNTEVSYEGNEHLKRSVTFSYDTWSLGTQGRLDRIFTDVASILT